MINYPKGSISNNKQLKTSSINYGSRGMSLEDQINASNDYYLNKKIAVIHKKPTPIQIVQVDYPRRSAAKITEAYFRQQSTTDYNGVYKGHYIDFEAKETKNKTRFPLNNLPLHQRKHMENCSIHGGIVFLILSFTFHGEIYLIPFSELKYFFNDSQRKSIPYNFIKKHGILCPRSIFPMIDYLKAVDIYLSELGID